MAVLTVLKQSRLIRPPRHLEPGLARPANLRYVYRLTAFISLGSFLFGWNQGVMGMIVADERWLKLMGHPSDWAVGFVVSVYNLSCALGALLVGGLADAYGRERTLALASAVTVLGALLQAAAWSLAQVAAGRFVVGLGVGAYAAGVPLYCAEISPPALRGRVGGITMMILCFAEMVVFLVDFAAFAAFPGPADDGWWRLPVALQVVPAAVLAVGCWRGRWVPPSPRWLVAEARYDCALEVLTRLHGSEAAGQEMREIRAAIDEELRRADQDEDEDGRVVVVKTAEASWGDMFRGPMLRVTLLGATLQFFQQATGTNALFYYTPALFRNGGITDPATANLATSGVGVVLFLSAWIPIAYFDRLGRKTWFQLGLVPMCASLVMIAVVQRHAEDHPGDPKNYAIILFPFLFFISFNASWSSGTWTYASEIFPNSLRVGFFSCTINQTIANGYCPQCSPKATLSAPRRCGSPISSWRR